MFVAVADRHTDRHSVIAIFHVTHRSNNAISLSDSHSLSIILLWFPSTLYVSWYISKFDLNRIFM